jgi:DNA polymerase III subunit epsilon
MRLGRSAGPSWSARLRPWREASFVALDFETTGLDPGRDDVISFGTVPIDGGWIRLAGSRYVLVKPQVPPSPRSMIIHGIRQQDLATAEEPDTARDRLEDALRGRFLVTWYASVENAFLAKVFDGRPSERSWARRNVDVWGLAMASGMGETGSLSLSAAAESLGVPVDEPHHAFDDALVTAELFLVFASRMASTGRDTVGRLIRSGRKET